MSKPGKISTDGGGGMGHNPFGALGGLDLPSSAKAAEGAPFDGTDGPKGSGGRAPAKPNGPAKNRGRVDIKRSTAGRGGKTVTVVSGFVGIGQPEKEKLTKQMRAACGCGGTVKDGQIEIQGDQRETITKILIDAGFRAVFAGG